MGTGLGLFVSYGIIERHRGSISVFSEPSGGTTFAIELPAIEAMAPRISSLPGIAGVHPLSIFGS
ncbi:MAG: ATP-binding protein [Pyrinomonadaceae bacterium]